MRNTVIFCIATNLVGWRETRCCQTVELHNNMIGQRNNKATLSDSQTPGANHLTFLPRQKCFSREAKIRLFLVFNIKNRYFLFTFYQNISLKTTGS